MSENLTALLTTLKTTTDPETKSQLLQQFAKESSTLTYLMDATNRDLLDITRIATGIKKIDQLLGGGLPMGSVTQLTSGTSTGKSTFVLQVCANALDTPSPVYIDGKLRGYQEHKIFLLSNEMDDSASKTTLIRQLAGSHNIEEVEAPELGLTSTRVKYDAWKEIENYYHDRIIFYEPQTSRDGFAHMELSIRLAISQGCDLIVLDNVMSITGALGLSEQFARYTDLQLQSYVAAWAQDLAKETGVCIILVAHKHKGAASRSGELNDDSLNEETSGSQAINNCSGVIMHLLRPESEEMQKYRKTKQLKADGLKGDELEEALAEFVPDDPSCVRYLLVSKNRITGRTSTGQRSKVHYDPKSRRMGDTYASKVRRCRWEVTDSVKAMREQYRRQGESQTIAETPEEAAERDQRAIELYRDKQLTVFDNENE